MATLLYRLGDFGARRWKTMVIGWLLVLGAVIGLGITFAGSFQNSGSIPGSPAQVALTKMDRHFPEPDAQSAQIVFQTPAGRKLTGGAPRAALTAAIDATGRVPGVAAVSTPADSGTISKDGRTAVAQVTFTTKADADVPTATLDAVKQAAGTVGRADVKVVYGGDAYTPSTSRWDPPS